MPSPFIGNLILINTAIFEAEHRRHTSSIFNQFYIPLEHNLLHIFISLPHRFFCTHKMLIHQHYTINRPLFQVCSFIEMNAFSVTPHSPFLLTQAIPMATNAHINGVTMGRSMFTMAWAE